MEARLMELETRFAFQDEAINELSEQLFQQQKQLEQLHLRLESLLMKLDEKGLFAE